MALVRERLGGDSLKSGLRVFEGAKGDEEERRLFGGVGADRDDTAKGVKDRAELLGCRT